MNKEIEHIIFDLGGVLVNIDLSRITSGFEEIMVPDESAGRMIREKLVPAYETGSISTTQFLDSLEPLLKPGSNRDRITEIWNSIFLDFPQERLVMLNELRKNYQVHLLSNINDLHAASFEIHFKTGLMRIRENISTVFFILI